MKAGAVGGLMMPSSTPPRQNLAAVSPLAHDRADWSEPSDGLAAEPTILGSARAQSAPVNLSRVDEWAPIQAQLLEAARRLPPEHRGHVLVLRYARGARCLPPRPTRRTRPSPSTSSPSCRTLGHEVYALRSYS